MGMLFSSYKAHTAMRKMWWRHSSKYSAFSVESRLTVSYCSATIGIPPDGSRSFKQDLDWTEHHRLFKKWVSDMLPGMWSRIFFVHLCNPISVIACSLCHNERWRDEGRPTTTCIPRQQQPSASCHRTQGTHTPDTIIKLLKAFITAAWSTSWLDSYLFKLN